MYTEDLAEFTRTMHDVARAMRAKITEADIATYYEALKDKPLKLMLERLREWQLSRRWFPTVAQLRSGDPDAKDDEPTHGQMFSPDWWTEVHAVEKRIAELQARPSGGVRLKPEADDIAAAEREVQAAARGLALHERADEAALWDRRYQRACLQRDRIKCMRRAAELEKLPAPADEQVRIARLAWIVFLREHADRARQQLVEFYSDDDPFSPEQP